MRKGLFLLLLLFFIHSLSAQQQTVGLMSRDTASYDGFTLFGPLSSTSTYLIDPCGRLVNQWNTNSPPGIAVYFLPDGNLLRTARVGSQVFSGGGIGGKVEILDWDGNRVWGANFADSLHHQHHDVEYLPNGNFLVLAWEYKSPAEAIAAGIDPNNLANSIWPEMILEVEPVDTDSVNIVWEWHLWDHLVQDFDSTQGNYGVPSDHPEKLDLNYRVPSAGPSGHADWIHANAVAYNPELDQIAISSRNLSEVWVIDHSTTTAEAATNSGGNSGKGGDLLYRWGNPATYGRGSTATQVLFAQHDVDWVPAGYPGEGNLMVFNNGLNRPGGNHSTVDEWTPPVDQNGNYAISPGQPFGPAAPDWSYEDPVNPADFFSSNISGAGRMPNGNTLICEGASGHLFEVDTSGVVVWDYIVPLANGIPITQGQWVTGNSTFRCYRYGADYPGFAGKDLTPGDPIEVDPLPVNCDTLLAGMTQPLEEMLSIYPNPARDWLNIESHRSIEKLELRDLTGRIVWSSADPAQFFKIPVNHLKNGLYLLKINGLYAHKVMITK